MRWSQRWRPGLQRSCHKEWVISQRNETARRPSLGTRCVFEATPGGSLFLVRAWRRARGLLARTNTKPTTATTGRSLRPPLTRRAPAVSEAGRVLFQPLGPSASGRQGAGRVRGTLESGAPGFMGHRIREPVIVAKAPLRSPSGGCGVKCPAAIAARVWGFPKGMWNPLTTKGPEQDRCRFNRWGSGEPP